MKKITKATFKKFVRENINSLMINVRSEFDGRIDGISSVNNGFFKAIPNSDNMEDNTLGIKGIWLVLGGGDHFRAYDKDGMKGIEVSNCCGCFIVAV